MDTDLNHVTLTGVLERDPITKFADHGTQQVSFTLRLKEPGPAGQIFKLFVPVEAYKDAATVAPAMPVAPAPARETYDAPDTMGRVVALQAHQGQRPATEPSTLQTMGAQPCERCGKSTCTCPPPPPRALEAAVARRKRELESGEQAAEAAGYPRIRPV